MSKQKHKTKVVNKELNPEWNELFVLIVATAGLRPAGTYITCSNACIQICREQRAEPRVERIVCPHC